MSLTTLRNLANSDFASGSGITASTLRTVISAILDVFSKNVSYSASIPFNCGAANMGQQILSANTVFTVNSTDATPGMSTILRLQGDGTHSPDLSNFKVINGTYVNTSGTNNLLLFVFDGTDYTVTIKQIPSTGGTGAGDTTPPVLTAISILNSAPSQVVLQYSEALGAVTPATSDFSFPTGGGTISSVVISGSQVLLNLSAPIGSGTTNTLTYTPGTNKIQDTSGNLAASFTAHSITNSVGSSAPTVIGANVHDTTTIYIGFSQSVTGGLGGWSFTKNGTAYTPSAIGTPAAATFSFTFASAMIAGDVLLVSYNSGTGNTVNGSSVPLASFTNTSITNGLTGVWSYSQNFDGVTPPAMPADWVHTGAVTAAYGSAISSPNVMEMPANGSTVMTAMKNAVDGNSGNIRVSINIRVVTSNAHEFIIVGRASTTTWGTMTAYGLKIWINNGTSATNGVSLLKGVSGTFSPLGSGTSVGNGATLAPNVWYKFTLVMTDIGGSTKVDAIVQRVSDGFYLNSSGTFVTGAEQIAYTNTDGSPITGAGYGGIASFVINTAEHVIDDFLMTQ